jgi:hypothetical protein
MSSYVSDCSDVSNALEDEFALEGRTNNNQR